MAVCGYCTIGIIELANGCIKECPHCHGTGYVDQRKLTPTDVVSIEELNFLLKNLVNRRIRQFEENHISHFPPELTLYSPPIDVRRQRLESDFALAAPWEHRELWTQNFGRDCWRRRMYVAAVFVSLESWITKTTISPQSNASLLEKYTNRQESFCVIGRSLDGRIVGTRLKISRSLNSGRILISEPVDFSYSQVYSDFLSSFYAGYFHEIRLKKKLSYLRSN